jgi:hypothetical protein
MKFHNLAFVMIPMVGFALLGFLPFLGLALFVFYLLHSNCLLHFLFFNSLLQTFELLFELFVLTYKVFAIGVIGTFRRCDHTRFLQLLS